MDLVTTLTALSAAPGPAGAEGHAAALAVELLTPYMEEVYTDALGNVIGRRPNRNPEAKKVLVEAHLDEVGFVVTGQKSGFLTLAPLGSVDPRHLPGARLQVLTTPSQTGVVACMPPHVLSKSAMDEVPKIEDLALDIGLNEDEAKKIPLGTPVVFDTVPMTMGDGLFSGKSLDNRASMAAVLLALSRLPKALDIDLTVLFSTQEELGLRGVQPGLFALEPDICVTLDVTFGHVPDAKPEQTVTFGGGAAIGIGPVLNRDLTSRLVSLAKAHSIPYQMEVLSGKSSTTADMGQVSRHGVATALISLPLRYMHSATELVTLADIEAVASLLTAFLGGADHA
ncbi:MAG: M42 family peptidase [Oscillospiraceae bacterium]|nr:M42 family peptidase [Oscillospiraceae bacterium]